MSINERSCTKRNTPGRTLHIQVFKGVKVAALYLLTNKTGCRTELKCFSQCVTLAGHQEGHQVGRCKLCIQPHLQSWEQHCSPGSLQTKQKGAD